MTLAFPNSYESSEVDKTRNNLYQCESILKKSENW